MKCRIHNNQPNAAQRKVLRAECVKEFDKLLAEYNREAALQVLYILRFKFGFGQERLKRFADELAKMQVEVGERYEMSDDCTWWICKKQLEESGIDLKGLIEC